MLKSFLFYFCSIFLFSACVSTDVNPPTTNGFFDLADFMDKELLDKTNRVKILQKTISLDDVTETKELTEFDLEKETALFRTANINKVAWLDRYETDSLFYSSGQLEQLIYETSAANLRTKRMSIHFDTKNQIDSIAIEQSSSSVVAESIQRLFYLPASGFRIENQQDITALDPHKLVVDVKFVY